MADSLSRFLSLTGDVVEVEDGSSRWPARLTVSTHAGPQAIDLFLGQIGGASRPERANIERRFQNPGQGRPIVVTDGRLPVLLGLWDNEQGEECGPVLALAEATRRVGRETRYSVFFNIDDLRTAEQTGWTSGSSGDGEALHYARPELFGALVALAAVEEPSRFDPGAARALIAASGLLDEDPPSSAATERARRSVSTLVRDRNFASVLGRAYGGMCAMCGLDFGLIEGAHILPVSKPGSSDDPSNGVALCSNHHRAFDKHLVYVEPVSHTIVIHPEIHDQAQTNAAAAAFVAGTYLTLTKPADPDMRPSDDFLLARYAAFDGHYAWLPDAD